MRLSAAARRNGNRAGRPTALDRLWTRLVMKAVLPEPLNPVTASRTVRFRMSPAIEKLPGRLHRHIEHDVGENLADHAAQCRLVRADRRREQPPRAAPQNTSGGPAAAAGPDHRERVGRFDAFQDAL